MDCAASSLAIAARVLYEPMQGVLLREMLQLADKCRGFQLLYYRLLAGAKCRSRRYTRERSSREQRYYKMLCAAVEDYGVEGDASTGVLQITLDEWSLQM